MEKTGCRKSMQSCRNAATLSQKYGNASVLEIRQSADLSIKNQGGNMRNKKIINLLILLLTAALLLSCEESTGPDNGEDPKPPGYQEEIPWSSLADSPWPMHRADPQATGRSKYPGPTEGIIDWQVDSLVLMTGVSIGADSNIYLTSSGNTIGHFSYSPEGNVNWRHPLSGYNYVVFPPAPIVESSGNIYMGSASDGFYYLNFNGKVIKKIEDLLIWQPSITIDKNGIVYCIDVESDLYAILKGEILWKYNNEDFSPQNGGISISPDGNTLYIPGINQSGKAAVYAFDINNKIVKWNFGRTSSHAAPLVDDEGNVFIITDNENGNTTLYSLT